MKSSAVSVRPVVSFTSGSGLSFPITVFSASSMRTGGHPLRYERMLMLPSIDCELTSPCRFIMQFRRSNTSTYSSFPFFFLSRSAITDLFTSPITPF